MTLINKCSKTLKWTTVIAIVLYLFFVGLLLNSTLQSNVLSKQQQSSSTKKTSADSKDGEIKQNVEQKSFTAKKMLKKSPLPTSPSPLSLQLSSIDQKSQLAETVILTANSVNQKLILEKAFLKADKNKDSYLTIEELARYINKKINEHIDWAIQNNPIEFGKVDVSPGDGLITWEEYHKFFLKEHGMNEDDISKHSEAKHTSLDRKSREDMMRDKARWSEAARTDFFSLTIDEYLSFRHPESSTTNLLELVDDLLRLFDVDGDDLLTIDEFADVTVNDDDDLYRKSLISQTVEERREEFKKIIDKNNDGKADRGELLNYVNPKSPRYSLQESATLFSLADENKDSQLSLIEIVDNAEIFLSSKMIDTANSFHEEF